MLWHPFLGGGHTAYRCVGQGSSTISVVENPVSEELEGKMARIRHVFDEGLVEVATTPEISGCIPIGASDKTGIVDTAQRFLRIVGIAVMAAGFVAAPAYAGDDGRSSSYGGHGHGDDDDDDDDGGHMVMILRASLPW